MDTAAGLYRLQVLTYPIPSRLNHNDFTTMSRLIIVYLSEKCTMYMYVKLTGLDVYVN